MYFPENESLIRVDDIYSELFQKYHHNGRCKYFVETGTHRGESVERAFSIGYKNFRDCQPEQDRVPFRIHAESWFTREGRCCARR